MICPTHKIIRSQTFSVAEMEYYIAQAFDLSICKGCQIVFEKRINKEINRSKLRKIVSDFALSNGQAGPDQTAVRSRSKQKR